MDPVSVGGETVHAASAKSGNKPRSRRCESILFSELTCADISPHSDVGVARLAPRWYAAGRRYRTNRALTPARAHHVSLSFPIQGTFTAVVKKYYGRDEMTTSG